MKIATLTRTPFILLSTFIFSSAIIPATAQDSLLHTITWNKRTLPPAPHKKYLSIRSLAAPTALISYGFISMHSEPLLNLNNKIREEVTEDMPSFQTKVDNYLKYAPLATVYTLNVLGVKGRHKLFGRTAIYIMSSVLTNQVVTKLKSSTKQLRPDGSTYTSFPSGHTATAFVGAELMNQEFGSRSPWYSVAAYTMAAGTALLRVMNNRHWLSDVIAGAGIGILSTKFCYWIYDKLERKKYLLKKIIY
ncbi:MAG TPA: phosphatase PAP2 family protein [Chitinophagaceae bacterium]|nr:phosphatase PAP2 family protein [Chitinophagaceae bacterium]